jgi:hypothetical protein
VYISARIAVNWLAGANRSAPQCPGMEALPYKVHLSNETCHFNRTMLHNFVTMVLLIPDLIQSGNKLNFLCKYLNTGHLKLA